MIAHDSVTFQKKILIRPLALWHSSPDDTTDLYNRSVLVSELPGYPGRRHMQWSRYVTAEFLCEAINTIDINFTQEMPGLAWVWNHQCNRFIPDDYQTGVQLKHYPNSFLSTTANIQVIPQSNSMTVKQCITRLHRVLFF